MNYTQYVKIHDEITGYVTEKSSLDDKIERLQDLQRIARLDFPNTFYVKVGDRMIFRSNENEDIQVVTPKEA